MTRWRSRLAALLVALAALLALVWYQGRPDVEAPAYTVALQLVQVTTLSPLNGATRVRAAGGALWVPAVAGQPLAAGDAVRTEPGAYALITFFDGTSTALESDTEFVIQRLDSDPAGLRTEIRGRLVAGGAWSRVLPSLDPGSRFEVETPGARTVARTGEEAVEMGVRVAPDGAGTVSVGRGEVVVEGSGAAVPVLAG